MPILKEKNIHRFFEISVFLKGLHAILETIGGILLYFVSTETLTQLVVRLTQEELTEDPNDFISHQLLQSAKHFSIGSKSFAAFYLLSHGVIKLFLVVGLLKGKDWAYPSSLVVLGFFIAYQVYRFTFTHSLSLIALTIFDLIVMWLIWQEYRLMQSLKPKN